ncbi:MAG: glucose-1-phosphate thymidylyltransferase [Chitinophagaceae bacterium]|nr:glucose-1-phosphate thymidylyltransferase [Chitinophagaceae bacterium]
MTILLDDLSCKKDFFPFGQLKSVAHIRIGMLTILEKWQFYFGPHVLLKSENPDLQKADFNITANHVPSLSSLKKLVKEGVWKEDGTTLNNPADIFKNNDWALRQDFAMITEGKESETVDREIKISGKENVFIEKGARLSFCTINGNSGPVYISRDSVVMEGAMIRGPFFCGNNSVVKMGAKIYGATTLGPCCMAGGEIKNSVLMGYSNKAHDGYLGDSVLGEWCNLGAGTSNSNLKNNASEVSVRFGKEVTSVRAGIKCGLIMGDYSRSAINTSFNTGSVVGVCSNIIQKTPEKFTDNFTWGNEPYELDKVIRDIHNWKKLKGFEITEEEILSIKNLYNKS